jgi:Domain of unknown function (DUF4157)/L,D-transpeptidase catalytic domain
VYQTIASPGHPLDAAVQRKTRAWFGADFSGVRIHTDAAAARSARDVDAHAYTVGEHIVFGTGRYQPDSDGGRRTLAHELTHVLQQRAAGAAGGRPLTISQPHDADERQAERAADAVLSGHRVSAPAGFSPRPARLARAELDEPEAEAATDASAAATYDGTEALDGDSPAGGPILPVPTSPEQLDSGVDETVEPFTGTTMGRLQRQRRGRAEPNRTRRPIPETRTGAWIESIEIDLEQQVIFLHWSDRRPVQEAPISSGRGRPCTPGDPCADQNSTNCTPTGHFWPTFRGDGQYHNAAGAHMSWYVDLGVRDARGRDRGIGIHDSQPVTGRPASHGCVRVEEPIARTINENVTTGTLVHIHGQAPTVPWRNGSCPRPRRGR